MATSTIKNMTTFEELATNICIYRIGSLRILDFNDATGSAISGITLTAADLPSTDIRGVGLRRTSNAGDTEMGMLVLRYQTGKIDAYKIASYNGTASLINSTDTQMGRLMWSV